MNRVHSSFRVNSSSCSISLVIALAVPLLAGHGAFAADSSSDATSNQSDWFSTSSGWNTDRRFYTTSTPPIGAWDFQYKHWFNAAAPPAAWTTKATVPKPPAATWDATTFSNNHQTPGPLNPADTYARSEWYVAPYQQRPLAVFGYYAKTQTRSKANASSPDTLANSKTQITDPWVLLKPATDPILNPTGQWTVGLDLSLFGTLSDHRPTTAIGTSYRADLTPAPQAVLQSSPLLEISIDGSSSHVNADSRWHLYVGGIERTPTQVESILNGFYTADGWSSNLGGFTIDNFRPDDPSYLSQVFNLQAALFLDFTTITATVYTTAWSAASAPASQQPVPEPETYALLVLGLGILAGFSWRRHTHCGAA
jgi:hypothetical protein